jgi:hypothetical protein
MLGCLREYETAKSFAGGEGRFRELARLLREQTGERFPPGWWFYGLDTYDKIWSRRIEPWRGSYAAGRFVAACRAGIGHVQNHSQGYYSDGWAGKSLHWMLPAGQTALEIRGNSPGWGSGLRLRVSVNGQAAAFLRPAAGDFVQRVPILDRSRPAVIRIDASPAIQPPGDSRRLAWRVESITPIA